MCVLYQIVFTHFPPNGQFGCLYHLTVVNSAAVFVCLFESQFAILLGIFYLEIILMDRIVLFCVAF